MKKLLIFITKLHGAFGDDLRKNINFTPPAHFILNKNKNCPFLNDKKLCEIYINLGPKSLCKICAEHPRYYEWFDEIKECGIGLCCEEAARIILSQTEPFSTYEFEIPYEDFDEYDNELYSYLYNSRNKIISYLDNSSLSFNSRICDVLWYGYMIQQNIDSNLLDDEDIFSVNCYSQSNIQSMMQSILEFFLTLEPNSTNWIDYLKNCILVYNESIDRLRDFEISHPEIFKYLQNISIYFIWRYFLKGTFDCDILSKVKLMGISIIVLKCLFFCKWVQTDNLTLNDCIEITKKYSEEIEYSDENLFSLADASYELEIFSIENLLSLFL